MKNGSHHRELVYRKASQLTIHPDTAALPMRAPDHPDVVAIDTMTLAHGQIITPLFIDQQNQVLDGRDRLRSARKHNISDVPCIVFADEKSISVILDAVSARKHFRRQALAYMALPLIEKAVSENIARRAAFLRKGSESPKLEKPESREEKGLGVREICEARGLKYDDILLARTTLSLFTANKKQIEKWLFNNPEERKLWENFGRDLESPWTKWRTERLADMGENPNDPTTATLIPENYREIYEEQLFAGEMGLGQINKALGSILATKGKTRGDLKSEDAESGLHITLCNKLTSFNKTMWKNWSALPVNGRLEVVNELTTGLAAWPQEAKVATFAKLKEELKK